MSSLLIPFGARLYKQLAVATGVAVAVGYIAWSAGSFGRGIPWGQPLLLLSAILPLTVVVWETYRLPAIAAARGGPRVLLFGQLAAVGAPPMAAIFAVHYGPAWWLGLVPALVGYVLARRVFVWSQRLSGQRR